ncbi:MAG: protoporphyrinogen oxidase [Acidobacteriota bacterium]
MRIGIIGGGISGLATAYYLTRRLGADEAEVTVLEASPRWGGIVLTERLGDFLLEGGPDSVVAQKPQALDLCRELGLQDEFITSPEIHRQAHVFSRGKLHILPRGLIFNSPIDRKTLAATGLLSWRGRLRLSVEPLLPSRVREDESVAAFVSRRLGSEVLERVVEPLISGIYGGDPDLLSAHSLMPRPFLAESQRASLTTVKAGASARDNSARASHAPAFVSLRSGMGTLITRLVQELEQRAKLHLEAEATSIRWEPEGHQVRVHKLGELHFDALVLAIPAHTSARLLADCDPKVADLLNGIPYTSSVVASLGYNKKVIDQAGAGFLIPRIEREFMVACTFASNKFPLRAPRQGSLLRCFAAGRRADDLMDLDDHSILEAFRRELSRYLGIDQEPSAQKVYRWEKAMPQYAVQHHRRIGRLQETLQQHPGLHLVGNFITGVGLSDCVAQARSVAAQLQESRTV